MNNEYQNLLKEKVEAESAHLQRLGNSRSQFYQKQFNMIVKVDQRIKAKDLPYDF